MAFGDFLGVLTGANSSIPASFSASGVPITVAVDDLVVVLISQATSITATAVNDNLGNTYSPTNAGTDAGNATGRFFYAHVSNAGSLTTVTASCTASKNDGVIIASVHAGPFDPSPLDAAPANATDNSSPYSCPLIIPAFVNELVVGWFATFVGTTTTLASAPFLLASNTATGTGSNTVGGSICYRVISALGALAPEFNTPASVNSGVVGTASFKQKANNDWAGAITFQGSGNFSDTANLAATASATFAGRGNFSATANLGARVSATFAGAGSFSIDTVPFVDWAGIVTFAPAGLFAPAASLRETARLTLAGTGAFTADAFNNKPASLTVSVTGSLAATAFLDNQATTIFAGAGRLTATAFLGAAVTVSFAATGALTANIFSGQAARVTFAGAGSLLALVKTQTDWAGKVTFTPSGLFNAATISNQVASLSCAVTGALAVNWTILAQNWQAKITFAGAGSFFGDPLAIVDAVAELALLGNQAAVDKFVSCDVATRDSRYLYIGYNQQIRGRPTVSFVSTKGVDSFVVYPDAHIGTDEVLTCRGLFLSGTYIKCPLDVDTLQTSAGVWEVSVTTPDTVTYLMTPDSKAQRFYMSVED